MSSVVCVRPHLVQLWLSKQWKGSHCNPLVVEAQRHTVVCTHVHPWPRTHSQSNTDGSMDPSARNGWIVDLGRFWLPIEHRLK